MHPQAQTSAEAVECAGLQGKFWEMHDQVFFNQDKWSGQSNALQILLGYGTELGLDEDAYQACVNEHETAQKISDDTLFANSVGITGTPFFVINRGGELYSVSGALPYEDFAQGIDNLLMESAP